MGNGFLGGHALVIGVANYPQVHKLPSTVLKDARDIADHLTSRQYCAYESANVELLIDVAATADGIRQAFRRMSDATGPNDTAVVYFSGHGGRVEQGPDAGTYLIPFDCDPRRLSETAIGAGELTALLSNIKAGRLVVLLDACHSAGAGELKVLTPLADIKAGLDEKTYDALAAGSGRVIMASSRSNEVSLILHGMTNSLFTYYLLEALKGRATDRCDNVIRVFEIFHYVADSVSTRAEASEAAQHPIFKAQNVESNFPLALRMGGKESGTRQSELTTELSTPVRPTVLSPMAKLAIKNGLVRRWDDLADYFGIPLSDRAKFEHGYEPQRVLEWLEERKRLRELRDAFNYLGFDDLIRELERNPR